MEPEVKRKALRMQMAPDYRGPRDDFFCWRFQIWYPSEDCVYRHSNRTHRECAGCFQGRLNLRHIEKGDKPPVFVPAEEEKTA